MAKRFRWSIAVHGMFDMHVFCQIPGNSVDEIINNWRHYNLTRPHRAIVGTREVPDIGELYLCPAILSYDGKQKRCLGQMLFHHNYTTENYADLWRKEVEADQYAVQAIARRDCSKIKLRWEQIINA